MNMTSSPVVLLTVPAIPVAVVRRSVKPFELSRAVPECCGLAWKAVRAQNAKAGRNVAIYWDGTIRLEAGVELQGPFAEEGEVVRSATPVGSAASTTHFGPYGGLGAAHAAIQEWCAQYNHRLSGPQWEIYGHWQEAWNNDPSQIRTDVFYQVTVP
jgi:effector-binding domain-containing protein